MGRVGLAPPPSTPTPVAAPKYPKVENPVGWHARVDGRRQMKGRVEFWTRTDLYDEAGNLMSRGEERVVATAFEP